MIDKLLHQVVRCSIRSLIHFASPSGGGATISGGRPDVSGIWHKFQRSCESKSAHWYRARPLPFSQTGRRFRLAVGLWAARRHSETERTSETATRDRTKPHTSEYCRHHFNASNADNLRIAASALVPMRPSTEKTRGVKVRRRAMQAVLYSRFFSRSCRARIFFGSIKRAKSHSTSVTLTSKIVVVPCFQNPCTEVSPREFGSTGLVPSK